MSDTQPNPAPVIRPEDVEHLNFVRDVLEFAYQHGRITAPMRNESFRIVYDAIRLYLK